jgi:hypothetical protein
LDYDTHSVALTSKPGAKGLSNPCNTVRKIERVPPLGVATIHFEDKQKALSQASSILLTIYKVPPYSVSKIVKQLNLVLSMCGSAEKWNKIENCTM